MIKSQRQFMYGSNFYGSDVIMRNPTRMFDFSLIVDLVKSKPF